MANELTVSLAVGYEDGDDVFILPVLSGLGIDCAGKKKFRSQQTIGFSVEEALGLGDMATLGIIWVWNTDRTNFLTIRTGSGAGKGCAKVLPGERWAWRLSGDVTAPYAIANTATVKLDYCIFEV